MKIGGREIKLAIFDLDGTLIDSNNVWREIDTKFFNSRGMEIPEKYTEEIAHVGLQKCAVFTKEKYGIKESVEEIIKEWQDGAYDAYANRVQLKEGVFEYLNYLKEQGVKLAIATANNPSLYLPCLKRLQIDTFFDFILDVSVVKVGKDNIKFYKTISEHFNICPTNTMILEDLSAGLKTSYDNGYLTIGMYDKYNPEYEIVKGKQYSHIYIESIIDLLNMK